MFRPSEAPADDAVEEYTDEVDRTEQVGKRVVEGIEHRIIVRYHRVPAHPPLRGTSGDTHPLSECYPEKKPQSVGERCGSKTDEELTECARRRRLAGQDSNDPARPQKRKTHDSCGHRGGEADGHEADQCEEIGDQREEGPNREKAEGGRGCMPGRADLLSGARLSGVPALESRSNGDLSRI